MYFTYKICFFYTKGKCYDKKQSVLGNCCNNIKLNEVMTIFSQIIII